MTDAMMEPSFEESLQLPRRYLQDHDVCLKVMNETTKGTRLFKNHVRAIFPRSRLFDVNKLVALQNLSYECKYFSKEPPPPTGTPSAEFWIRLSCAQENIQWAKEPEWLWEIRYFKRKASKGETVDEAFVRASDECLRHELETNGGRTPTERSKATKGTSSTQKSAPAVKPLEKTGQDTGNTVVLEPNRHKLLIEVSLLGGDEKKGHTIEASRAPLQPDTSRGTQSESGSQTSRLGLVIKTFGHNEAHDTGSLKRSLSDFSQGEPYPNKKSQSNAMYGGR
ncbi:expressed unknown protein [Seminavis robusta]|uniref:Uncharacterized protein n=1 Tax=Seminavis robusta TaxID=568900 RepID=A0A9N8H351_9STRA|nr:expressed unknown protein [Seminavis robusta]|eukprot:Sro31_g020270.1 n/a (280) ;mRNA; r:79760-80599